MDTSYSVSRSRPKFLIPLIFFMTVLLLAGISYLLIKSRRGLISPLPDEPAVEVIFYTPTPEPVTPTASPSATPRQVRRAEVTATPKIEATVSPTANP